MDGLKKKYENYNCLFLSLRLNISGKKSFTFEYYDISIEFIKEARTQKK